jgi:hypothetical protein
MGEVPVQAFRGVDRQLHDGEFVMLPALRPRQINPAEHRWRPGRTVFGENLRL